MYLTDALYVEGAIAAQRLSITGKAVELSAEMTDDPPELDGPSIVEPLRDPSTGLLVREGGGREFTFEGALSADSVVWFTLEAP